MSLVERARIVRNLDEAKLARAILALLHPKVANGMLGGRPNRPGGSSVGRSQGGAVRRIGGVAREFGQARSPRFGR